ncbi:NAD-dependent succinate-semialdehyde dehydrogenase [Mycobacteroides salmoniphilum]|uniref:Glutarate-semialdehyde dehydrogenase DavD n=1 Tax=Mycobacteroides salmoniphilum TaxID=404941 RepID=A0A4V3HZU1_9MYCO|nr:NAD-dependent succinate-semialdehyde dehydrogenase [Mycobacteroides salmoniphilum]TDZ96215.1 Glutarate-semialdehyde dehydrogenase DavD [Mycobacteroides salmoniphilum]TEA05312.1 Glutarate-semialdehyde dehydrogenase DavD [Mycobacteroides salmoniphilum]
MTDHSALIDAIPTDLWIGGKQVPSSTGARFPVHNPATGAVLTTVADASATDGAIALDEAVAVQQSWAATAPRERAEILRRAWELVIARRDEFALAMTLEMGKPLAESQGEVAYGGEFLRWFSEEAVRVNGRYTSSPTGSGRILVTKQPIGPALAITPWNFPLAMGTRKIGPAFAAGCTMIVKPAAETPLTMLLLGQVFADAGLPPGVLSILPTTSASGLTGPLIDDPRLRKLTFTGSTGVGKVLLSQCATRVLRSSMELGGNAPFVVFDDADVDAAVDGAMAAKMRNIGEACTAANRFHVDNAVRAEFTEKLTARMGALTIGPGDESGVQVGPLITAKQRASVDELVQDAVNKGAVITTGGAIADGEGYFYPPTVLTDVPANARILREEVFGPVAAITGFDGEDAGVAAANDTEYGLAAYVYTANLDRALRVSESVESGMIGINRGVISDVAAPFGGIKESGIGREAGSEGIEEYLETKYIALP